MIGTAVNVLAILVGGIVGLLTQKDLSPTNQSRIKIGLAILTVYVGLSVCWRASPSGAAGSFAQALILVAALILGNLIGRLLGLQDLLNRLGRNVETRYVHSQGSNVNRFNDAFLSCTVLFCLAPISLLGALVEGLSGDYRILIIKSVLDGLAAVAFSRTFGWGVLLSALPVLAWQGTITLLADWLRLSGSDPALLNSITAAAGLLFFCVALTILNLQKVPLANYLPTLATAPLLTWIFR